MPEYTGRFRRAIFRLGDEPDSPVILETFLEVTPAQGMHVVVKDAGEARYLIRDVTLMLEEGNTGGEDPQTYYEPTVYVDLEEV